MTYTKYNRIATEPLNLHRLQNHIFMFFMYISIFLPFAIFKGYGRLLLSLRRIWQIISSKCISHYFINLHIYFCTIIICFTLAILIIHDITLAALNTQLIYLFIILLLIYLKTRALPCLLFPEDHTLAVSTRLLVVSFLIYMSSHM